MTAPKLSVGRSGFGGRGYKSLFNPEAQVVPGVTTVLNAVNKPALIPWATSQVAAYAVTNLDKLELRDEEQGYNFLRFYTNRFKPDDFDNPNFDLYNAHTGVLHDAASLGNWIHYFIECDLNGWLEPDALRVEHEQMAEAYLLWKMDNDVEVYATEATVFGNGYAGTADLFGKINGVNGLYDVKSSRSIWNEHRAQLSALGAAHTMAVEVDKDTEGAVYHKIEPKVAEENGVERDSWWLPQELPPVQQYGIIHVRPDDYDNKGNFIPAFCEFKTISQAEIDAAFIMFQGALQIKESEFLLKELAKEEERLDI